MSVPTSGLRALLVRHKTGFGQLVKFALVGGSGVVVNLVVFILCHKVSGHSVDDILVDLPLTTFNIRWYHFYATVAFIFANLWNFQINRRWTFKTHGKAPWLKEFLPFFAVGLAVLVIGLGVLTLLMKPESPLFLLPQVLDGSTGFRTRSYWAQLIQVIVTTPVSFVLNKLWTFRVLRQEKLALVDGDDDTERRLSPSKPSAPFFAGVDTATTEDPAATRTDA